MSRLVVVSNRVTVATDTKARAGGLAVALQDALRQHGGIWFGWSGKVVPETTSEVATVTAGPVTYATVDLSRKDHAEYYNGFANQALWPLFHYRLGLTLFEQQDYDGYLRVNSLFAERLLPLLKAGDVVWVHDYHLIPLAEELRRAGSSGPMGFFLHTPFPAMEVLVALPWHRSIVRSLCAYDVVGFHTMNDLRAFHDYIVHEVGGGVMEGSLVHAFGRTLKTGVFPIGIDTQAVVKLAQRATRTARFKHIVEHPGERSWIIGVDRLDYSKGLLHRFRAFERLLEAHPETKGKVTLVQIAAPSRAELRNYKEIRRALEAEAGRINGRHGNYDWIPVNYLNRSFVRNDLFGLYRGSGVGLVTPLRDGMNLVAKEYVASQDPENPGVLVLSRFAGAARELDAALVVNPFDLDAVAEAIARGLVMSVEERRERWAAMMAVLRGNTLEVWRDRFLAVLAEAPYEV